MYVSILRVIKLNFKAIKEQKKKSQQKFIQTALTKNIETENEK